MASQPPPDEYDHREEGCSLFEWPLSDDPQWDRTLIFPRFGDVVVDRDRRQVSVRCMWKIKADYQMKGTKK